MTKQKNPVEVFNDFISSNIKEFQYDNKRKLLTVEFHNGTSYLYKDVPKDTLEAVLVSESIGKAFNQLVKGKFEYRKFE